MIPTWVAVVTGISLAILAVAAIAIALSSVPDRQGRRRRQQRLADVDALFEVMQEEVETTALDVAVWLRKVRRGLSILEWGRRAIRRRRKR